MTAPTHHLPEDWLIAYAGGGLTEAQCVVVATHLTLCPACRQTLAIAEEAAASTLMRAEAPLDPAGLDALMARLDEPEAPEPPAPVDAVLPWPVLRFTGPLAGQPWKWLGPGVHGVDLPQPTDGLPLRLIRMRAGARMPHRHEGFESGVVLAGGWDDEYGTYRRGDATVYAPDTHPTHDQRIHDDADCIAIVLNESRAVVEGRLFGPLARLLFRI
ncbi:MAG: zf-HC2 domain-containing protein [Alphaproteobacteria bacterium]|nr:zf-HC2 domain-containing protein [Alphaproteobacteria bacterium]